MSNPTRPTDYPIWTQGNPAQRAQPTNGQQFGGFVPNFRPPSKMHNWLFGIMSDWIAWFDFITFGGTNFAVSNVGHNILTGTNLQAQLDECDAFLSSLGLEYLTMAPTSATVFTLNKKPVNVSGLLIFLDGLDEKPTTDFVYSTPGNIPTITFTNPVAPGQVPFAITLTANQAGAGGSAITGGFVPYGDALTPVAINPAAGVTSTADQRAIIFTASTGGVAPVTANPQVTAGGKVGQELRLVGTSDVNAITLANGSGLLLNGGITLGNGVSIDLYWNGSVWAESDRSN